MARKSKTQILDLDESIDNGFIEGDEVTGNVVSFFNFSEESSTASAPIKAFNFNTANPSLDKLDDNRKSRTEANTTTPPIEGEAYTVGRYYKLRYSTAKMLNEIKASHPDVNIYMNTLVDEAIRYYYSYVFEKDT
jgi:hypothetical protein